MPHRSHWHSAYRRATLHFSVSSSAGRRGQRVADRAFMPPPRTTQMDCGGPQVNTCATCGGRGVVTQVMNTILGRIQQQTPCPTCASGRLLQGALQGKCFEDDLAQIARISRHIKECVPHGDSNRCSNVFCFHDCSMLSVFEAVSGRRVSE